jgi:hypothetical protein
MTYQLAKHASLFLAMLLEHFKALLYNRSAGSTIRFRRDSRSQ